MREAVQSRSLHMSQSLGLTRRHRQHTNALPHREKDRCICIEPDLKRTEDERIVGEPRIVGRIDHLNRLMVARNEQAERCLSGRPLFRR